MFLSQVSSCGCWLWVSVLAVTPLASQSSNMWLTCMETRWTHTHTLTHAHTHTHGRTDDPSLLTGSRTKRRLKRSTKAIQSQTHSTHTVVFRPQTVCVCVCVCVCVWSVLKWTVSWVYIQISDNFITHLWMDWRKRQQLNRQQKSI